MSTNFVPKIVQGIDWLDRIARFRVKVWTLNNMIDLSLFPENLCLEDVDHCATQLVIEENGELCAAVRYTQYSDINNTHLGIYYRESGIVIDGPIGIPERLVVHPDVTRQGVAWKMAKSLGNLGVERGARYMVSECSPKVAALMRKRKRVSLGFAPDDPRFPGVRFEWMLSDIEIVAKQLAKNSL